MAAMDSYFYLPLALLCLVMLSIAYLRRSQQRRASTRALTRDQRARLRQQQELRQSMAELLTQIERVAQQVSTRAGVQLAELQATLKQVDQRMGLLKDIHGGPTVPRPGNGTTFTTAQGTPSAAAECAGQPPGLPAGGAVLPQTGGQDQRQRVYELSDAGLAPPAIASTLRMPLGEVQLVLGLRAFQRCPAA